MPKGQQNVRCSHDESQRNTSGHCKPCRAAYMREWNRQNPHKSCKRFGVEISREDYNALLIKQDYCCAICRIHISELGMTLGVDHNHKTGVIRGLLCKTCNVGIGYLKDSPLLLMAAADYLSR